jgi:acetyl esterase/lipase
VVVVHSVEKLTPVRIRYGTNSEQFGDLYLPEQRDDLVRLSPLMILIHGGYWKDNHNLNSYATSALIPVLIALGWAVWNIEYRRMDSLGENIKAPWPIVFSDVACAVDSVRKFADEYALDTQNVAVLGHSAGGCLALWAANRRQIPATSPLFNANPLVISSAMSISGVLSLTHPEDLCQPEQIIRLMGGSKMDWPERYQACDPSQLHDPSVRTIIIHGEKDETVRVNQALHYIENTPKTTQLEIWPETDHFSMFQPGCAGSNQQWKSLHECMSTFFKIYPHP